MDEQIRRVERAFKSIANESRSREWLEERYPNEVWSPEEFVETFDILFADLWPVTVAQRKHDGAIGVVMAQRSPALFYAWKQTAAPELA